MKNKKQRDMKPYGDKVSEGFWIATRWAMENEPELGRVLDRANLSLSIQSLDMDVIGVIFPKRKSGSPSSAWALLWDWIDARTPEEIAEYIIETAHENVAQGKLPISAEDFAE